MSSHPMGGCQCGAVRYQSSSQPAFGLTCYCRQCQRITGTGHAAQFALASTDVAVAGNIATYVMKADSGNAVTSAFCPTCGSPIYKQSNGYPQFLFFHAATLDDPATFAPQQSFWTSQKQPWDTIDDKLPRQP